MTKIITSAIDAHVQGGQRRRYAVPAGRPLLLRHHRSRRTRTRRRPGPGVRARAHVLSSGLTFCDMTTNPDGELVPAEKRLAETRPPRPRAPGEPVNPAGHADDPPGLSA